MSERERECVCVCVRERERERESVCVCVRERESVCVCVREREREREGESVCERERGCVCVCVCVYICRYHDRNGVGGAIEALFKVLSNHAPIEDVDTALHDTPPHRAHVQAQQGKRHAARALPV